MADADWQRSRTVMEDAVPTDEELVAVAQADRRAFAPLYRRYAELVYRFCDRRLQSRSAAEDVTAAVFERALTALPRFSPRGPGSFRSWLFTIAHHAIVNIERDRHVSLPLDEAFDVADAAPGPDEVFGATESRDDAWALIATLPETQQRILELRLAGLTGREIAAVLGMSHGAVKAAQFRAFTRLRAALGLTTTEEEPS